tara:strand:- start:12547 stop:13047 length:501 start_codon:yes stop_codon:yes gene_type:complete
MSIPNLMKTSINDLPISNDIPENEDDINDPSVQNMFKNLQNKAEEIIPETINEPPPIQEENINEHYNNDIDFENEMDELVNGHVETNNIYNINSISNNDNLFNKNNIIKCIIIIAVFITILNIDFLKIFEKYIPLNLHSTLIEYDKQIYYLVIFIILYVLYHYKYI